MWETPEAAMSRTTLSLALLFVCAAAKAQEPPEKIRLDYRRGPGAPMAIPGHEHHYAYLVDLVSVTGKKSTGVVVANNPRNGEIVFPRLRNEEVIPLFGALYRADGPDLVLLKDPPKGLAIARDSFAVPLRRDENGSGKIGYRVKDNYDSTIVFVTAIEKDVARVKVGDIRNEAREVRKGDVLKFGPTEWEVRGLVPAGDGAIGWVELGPKKVK